MKTSLLFDGNHFLYRALSVAGTAKTAECGKALDFRDDPAGDRRLLLHKMADMFAAEVTRFKGISDQVVYCVDSPTWRKIAFPSEDYKGNRTRDDSSDWESIKSAYIEFQAALEANGVVVSRTRGAEADDLLFYWSQALNHWAGRSAVVISGDGDLLQLVGRDQATGAFTLVHNKLQASLNVFPGFAMWLDAPDTSGALDVFEDFSAVFGDDRDKLRAVVKSLSPAILEVDPSRFIFKKILTGDAGDNVKSVFQRVKPTKAGDRTYRVTPLMADKVLERYERDHMFFGQLQMFDDSRILEVAAIVKDVVSATDEEATVEQIADRWRVNRDLVYLHARCIPDHVMKGMQEHYEGRKASFTGPFSSSDLVRECPSCAVHAVEPPQDAPPQGKGFDRDKWKRLKG